MKNLTQLLNTILIVMLCVLVIYIAMTMRVAERCADTTVGEIVEYAQSGAVVSDGDNGG